MWIQLNHTKAPSPEDPTPKP